MRALIAAAVVLAAFGARAHDLITADAAQRYLGDAQRWGATLRSAGPPAERGEAHYRMGVMFEEIRELLNRDLAAHGEVQGLPSNFLVAELERAGTPLARSQGKGHFLTNSGYFSEAVRLAPRGAFVVDAQYRLLKGRFYDSFEHDPLVSGESGGALREQIALAETLLKKALEAAAREEVEFIAAILYTRAAKAFADPAAGRNYADRAHAAISGFESRYPESLRAAAMPVLRESLGR